MKNLEVHFDRFLMLSKMAAVTINLSARLPFLRQKPINDKMAHDLLKERLNRREANFLDIIQRAIYKNNESPYLNLLYEAGCEYGDLEDLVYKNGIEYSLRTLFENGVFLSVDEFKGRKDAVRGSSKIKVDPAKLRNPLTSSHVRLQTSGSGGVRTQVSADLAFLREYAVNQCLALKAHGGSEWLKAVWEGPGGAAIFRLLIFNIFGNPPVRWFLLGNPKLTFGWEHTRTRLWSFAVGLLRWSGRLGGVSIPRPIWGTYENPILIAQWMAEALQKGHTPFMWSFPSAALRLCQAAKEAAINLEGARFEIAGEPITASRLNSLRQVGAIGIPAYGSIEAGRIGVGCLEPEASDDVHFYHDSHALIQAGSNQLGLPSGALFITSLLPTAPFVLLNVSMGDRAILSKRLCGCPMETFGWDTHIHEIRSYEKLTTGGLTLLDTDIIRAIEKVLPSRFGGSPIHYQLIEEKIGGQPRLTLLVHPIIENVNIDEVAKTFLKEVNALWLLWERRGFFRVKRRIPVSEPSGKVLHLHINRKQ